MPKILRKSYIGDIMIFNILKELISDNMAQQHLKYPPYWQFFYHELFSTKL